MSECIIIVTSDKINADEVKDVIATKIPTLYNENNPTIVITDVNDIDNFVRDTLNEKNIPFKLIHTDFDKYGGKARRIRNVEICELAKWHSCVTIILIGAKLQSDYYFLKDLLCRSQIKFSEETLSITDPFVEVLF